MSNFVTSDCLGKLAIQEGSTYHSSITAGGFTIRVMELGLFMSAKFIEREAELAGPVGAMVVWYVALQAYT